MVSDDYDDMRAIAAYEAMRMRRGRGEGIYEGYDANYAVNENLAPVSEFSGEELPTELNFESYGEREIAKYLKESDRRVREYERAISKKEKSMRKLSREDKTRALLDTVNLNKHVVDLRAVALRAVVISADTKSKKQRRRLLVDAINNYNSALSDYEARSQESFKKLSLSLVADVSEGKPYTPVALISYSGESALNLSESFADSENDEAEIISRREMNLEGLRFLKETRREEKRIARYAKGKTSLTIGRGEKITSFTKNIERDAYLVKTRNDSLLTEAESSLDYLEYSFSASHKDKARARREIKEKIRKLKKTRKSSVKLARRDSERYYSQLLVNAEGLGITKRLTVDKLESLHMRLEALLSERERINEQLIKLYSGDLRGGKDKKINKKIKRVKARVAKRVSKRFRRNMRVLEKRVPLDIKEKLAKSVNKIIDAEILIATLKLKIRKTKPKRDVKRDMKAKIRENRAAIKYYLADYRRFLKRARAYAERSFGIKIQIIWVLASLAVLITLGAFYIRFEEPVNAFFARVFDYIGSAM